MPTLQELLCGVTLASVANVAADLETTQAPYYLDLEWWAVQGSNL